MQTYETFGLINYLVRNQSLALIFNTAHIGYQDQAFKINNIYTKVINNIHNKLIVGFLSNFLFNF